MTSRVAGLQRVAGFSLPPARTQVIRGSKRRYPCYPCYPAGALLGHAQAMDGALPPPLAMAKAAVRSGHGSRARGAVGGPAGALLAGFACDQRVTNRRCRGCDLRRYVGDGTVNPLPEVGLASTRSALL